MKLFFLEHADSADVSYDDAIAFVIAANSEQEAREIANLNGGDERFETNNKDFWLNTNTSSCMVIAEDCIYTEPRIVLRDFWEP